MLFCIRSTFIFVSPLKKKAKNLYLKNIQIYTILFYLFTAPFQVLGQNLYLQLKIEKTDSTQHKLSPALRFPDFSSMEKHVLKTVDSIQKTGFFSAKVTSLNKENDTLYISTLALGAKINLIQLYLQDSLLNKYGQKLQLTEKNGHFLIATGNLEDIMANFTALEAASGHPLSSFQLKNVTVTTDTLKATLSLDREKLRRINKIVVNGYDKFPRAYLKYYANLNTGKLFDKSRINKNFNQLTDLPFVNPIKDPEVLFENDSTTVFLYLEKNPANRFDGFLGFGNSADSGKLRLDGYLDLHLLNNLDYGELLEINYKSDGNDQQTLRAAIELPFLFSTPLGLKAELNLFRRDTTFSTNKQELDLFYQFPGNLRLSTGVLLENSTALNDSLAPLQNQIVDYEKTLFNIGFSKVSRANENLFPIKSMVSFKTSYGNRNVLNISESQFAVEGEASYVFNLSQKQRFYIANTTKNLITEQYYSNELFRFGGITSIRGFNENSINANFYTIFRSEYRYLAAPGLYVHSVADAAYFENQLLNEQSFIYSFGLGAGILTNAGLLNINFANGLRERENFKFSNTILHLRLTTFF
jgi:hemolysin activation/secretion protein